MVKKKNIKAKARADKARSVSRPATSFLDNLLASKQYVYYYMGFIFLLTIILFNEFVFSGKMLFSSDGINASLYFRQFLVDSIKDYGYVPQWSPMIFGGMPFVEAFHSDIFYPLTILFKLIMPIPQAFGWSMLFHVFLSGLFMYLCARAFGLSKLAASFAGIFYMFAPYLVSMVQPGHDGKMYVTALFPLTMLFLERGLNHGKFIDFTMLGAVIGLIILSPHPQMSYFSLWGIGFYFGFRIIFMLISKKSILPIIKPSLLFGMAVVLGLFISAMQFYPAYKYVKEYSPRSEDEVMTPQKEAERYAYATSWSMNAEELAAQFIPNFCGSNATKFINGQEAPPTYWGQNFFKDNSEYIGILPIFFGLIAIIFVREKRTWFFMGLGAFALVYALGGSTPFYKIFYYLIPNVKHLRAPSMIMFLFSFSFCLLAGFGINFIQKKLQDANADVKNKITIFSLVVPAIYIMLAFLMSAGGKGIMAWFKNTFNKTMPDTILDYRAYAGLSDIIIGLWILAIIFVLIYLLIKAFSDRKVGLWALGIIMFFGIVDAWRMDLKFLTTTDQDQYFAENSIVRKLKSVDQAYVDRVLVTDRGILRSKNYFAYHEVPQMFGYHGNQMKIYDKYWGRVGKSNDHSLMYRIYFNRQNQKDPNNGMLEWLNIPLLNLAGVKYIVADNGTKVDKYDSYLVSQSTMNEIQRDKLVLYKIEEAMGRCRIYHNYIVNADQDLTITQMNQPQFDWKNTIFLSEDPGLGSSPILDSAGEKAIITHYEPNRVMVDVSLNSDGLLYLADAYYPAWQAYVDGEKAKIIQANVAFRAVPLSPGEHQVEFRFESKAFNNSRVVSYASMAFVCAVLILNVFNYRRKGKSSSE